MIISKLIESNDSPVYKRKFEIMGNKILLVRIDKDDFCLSPFHWIYENNMKPPLDIAINTYDATIKYITFFIQEDELRILEKMYNITYVDALPTVDINAFNEKKYTFSIFKTFTYEVDRKDMYIIKSDSKDILFAYTLSINDYVLCNSKGDFSGLLLKNISKEEKDILIKAGLY